MRGAVLGPGSGGHQDVPQQCSARGGLGGGSFQALAREGALEERRFVNYQLLKIR